MCSFEEAKAAIDDGDHEIVKQFWLMQSDVTLLTELFCYAMQKSQFEIADTLLTLGNVPLPSDIAGKTPVRMALDAKQFDLLTTCAIAYANQDLNLENYKKDFAAALPAAIKKNNLILVGALLQTEIDLPEVVDNSHPLNIAARHGRWRVLAKLALYVSENHQRMPRINLGESVLKLMATGNVSIVHRLIHPGIELNIFIAKGECRGYSPLHFVVSKELPELTTQLLAHGANPLERLRKRPSAFEHAIKEGDVESVELFISHVKSLKRPSKTFFELYQFAQTCAFTAIVERLKAFVPPILIREYSFFHDMEALRKLNHEKFMSLLFRTGILGPQGKRKLILADGSCCTTSGVLLNVEAHEAWDLMREQAVGTYLLSTSKYEYSRLSITLVDEEQGVVQKQFKFDAENNCFEMEKDSTVNNIFQLLQHMSASSHQKLKPFLFTQPMRREFVEKSPQQSWFVCGNEDGKVSLCVVDGYSQAREYSFQCDQPSQCLLVATKTGTFYCNELQSLLGIFHLNGVKLKHSLGALLDNAITM